MTESYISMPPEVTTARARAFIGADASWVLAAAQWNALVGIIGANIATLTASNIATAGAWQGKSSAAFNAKITPLLSWYTQAEAIAVKQAASANTVAAAAITLQATVVPLTIIELNRAIYYALLNSAGVVNVVTGILSETGIAIGVGGAIDAAIVAAETVLEEQYEAFRVIDATAMRVYDSALTAATAVSGLTAPNPPVSKNIAAPVNQIASELQNVTGKIQNAINGANLPDIKGAAKQLQGILPQAMKTAQSASQTLQAPIQQAMQTAMQAAATGASKVGNTPGALDEKSFNSLLNSLGVDSEQFAPVNSGYLSKMMNTMGGGGALAGSYGGVGGTGLSSLSPQASSAFSGSMGAMPMNIFGGVTSEPLAARPPVNPRFGSPMMGGMGMMGAGAGNKKDREVEGIEAADQVDFFEGAGSLPVLKSPVEVKPEVTQTVETGEQKTVEPTLSLIHI